MIPSTMDLEPSGLVIPSHLNWKKKYLMNIVSNYLILLPVETHKKVMVIFWDMVMEIFFITFLAIL